jgi:hypothetical protein
MGLQKASPGRSLAADRGWIQSIALANVVNGRIAQRVTQIVQGTHDPVAAPGRVLFDQLENELFEFWIHGWSTERICSGKGPLLGDEHPEPSKQGVRSNDGAKLSQAVPSERLRSAGKPHSLGVSEAFGFTTQLFEQNAILFLKVRDHRLLMSVHPANDGDQNELKLGCHG